MATREDAVDIAVPGDGRIAGTFVSPSRLYPGVLFVHGWGGSQAQYLARARRVSALGCVCLTFDLRGHAAGRANLASVTRAQNLDDLLAAYDRLVAHRFVDPASIALVGSSYGGYLASIATTLRPVRWLALRAPALYIDSGWETPKLELHRVQDLVQYRQQRVPAAENRALAACARFRGDALLVESEFDDLIPHAVIASYRDALGETRSLSYRLMKGADHGLTDPVAQQAYSDVLLHWLGEMLSHGESARDPGSVPMHETVPPETPPESR